jgi:hypothetical protein
VLSVPEAVTDAGRGSGRLATLAIPDPAAHTAALTGVESSPHAGGLIRGQSVLEACFANRALFTDRFRRFGDLVVF